jgi:hypothetical protein
MMMVRYYQLKKITLIDYSNPCSSHYLKAITIMQGKAVEVLKLGFSSKTLKENYLQGINLNIKTFTTSYNLKM